MKANPSRLLLIAGDRGFKNECAGKAIKTKLTMRTNQAEHPIK